MNGDRRTNNGLNGLTEMSLLVPADLTGVVRFGGLTAVIDPGCVVESVVADFKRRTIVANS